MGTRCPTSTTTSNGLIVMKWASTLGDDDVPPLATCSWLQQGLFLGTSRRWGPRKQAGGTQARKSRREQRRYHGGFVLYLNWPDGGR
ncbi:unnamed protein product [Ectocarpus sp. 13 AM-2016]